MPTDCKNDDMICFPIHSYNPCARTALKIYPISTGALLPVLEDGVAPAFPAGPALAWLPPAALAGHSHHPPPSRVTAKESLCNKSPSITRPTTLCRGVFTSSPVPRVFLCFPICHVPPLPHKLSVGSEQDPHWQPGAGQPQLTANSLLLFVCQLSNWHQYGEHNCCICTCSTNKQQRQAPVFPVSGLCICLLRCLPLGIDMRLVGNLPGANGNCVH